MLYRINKNIILAGLICIIFSGASYAQTSEFNFQGKLTDQNAAANGIYDMSFKLYDAGNLQVGATLVREDVQVTNGAFTVQLDFGAAAFDGGARSIEILVRGGTSTGAFTTLAPKQSISSTRYAVRSQTATTADTATSAARPPEHRSCSSVRTEINRSRARSFLARDVIRIRAAGRGVTFDIGCHASAHDK